MRARSPRGTPMPGSRTQTVISSAVSWTPATISPPLGQNLTFGEEAKPFGRGPDDSNHVHIVEQQLGGAALDARQVKQFVDHLDQVTSLDLDLGDPVTQSR